MQTERASVGAEERYKYRRYRRGQHRSSVIVSIQQLAHVLGCVSVGVSTRPWMFWARPRWEHTQPHEYETGGLWTIQAQQNPVWVKAADQETPFCFPHHHRQPLVGVGAMEWSGFENSSTNSSRAPWEASLNVRGCCINSRRRVTFAGWHQSQSAAQVSSSSSSSSRGRGSWVWATNARLTVPLKDGRCSWSQTATGIRDQPLKSSNVNCKRVEIKLEVEQRRQSDLNSYSKRIRKG